MRHVVLASASPRRLELLLQLGLDVDVAPADIDEAVWPAEDPVAYVLRLAAEKGAVVAPRHPQRLVIAADTTVDLDGAILGKPADHVEATAMLRSLSDRDHIVHTGVSVWIGGVAATGSVSTTVRFADLSDRDIAWYVATGEPFGKAGAYAIQGAGGALVESVVGSVSNVVGLPLALVVALARSVGVELLGNP
jgi:septum formation protein